MVAFYFQYVFILAAFVVIYYVAGFLTYQLIAPAELRQKLPVLQSVSLGIVFWIYAVFLFSALHILHSTTLYATASVVVAGFLILKFIKRKSASEFTVPTVRLEPDQLFLAFCLAGIMVLILGVALSSRLSADAINYHLLFPEITVRNHGFTWISFKPITNWPLNVELLFAIALIVKDYVLAKAMHFTLGALLLVAIYQFTKENRGSFAGMLAVVFFLMNDVVVRVMPRAYSDLGVAFFFFMAFWYVTKALKNPKLERHYLLLAGIFAGAMAGCKMNAFLGGVILGLVYLCAGFREKGLVKPFGRMMLYFGLPAVLLLSPWLIKNAVMTGNPVYPFLYGIFGGPEWNEQLSADMTKVHIQMMGMGREPIDYLLLPFRVIWYGQWEFDHFWGIVRRIWIVLIPLSMIVGIRRRTVRWALLGAGLFFISWALQSQQMRFLIPMLALLSFCAAVSVTDVISRIKDRKRMRAAEAVILIAASCYLLFAVNSHSLQPKSVEWSKPKEIVDKITPQVDFINKNLPENAKVVFINDNHCLYLEREFACDNFLNVSQIGQLLLKGKTGKQVRTNLKRNGFTHVLFINHGEPAMARLSKGTQELLRDSSLILEIYKRRKVEIYELL
jgi:hypothetical protein